MPHCSRSAGRLLRTNILLFDTRTCMYVCMCLRPVHVAPVQHPPGGRRTPDQNAAFDRALKVMAGVYASAVGTTVLQLKEIPPRPAEFDGAICLFGLATDQDEAAIRARLQVFGEIKSCDLTVDPVTVCFATHAAALKAKQAHATLKAKQEGLRGGCAPASIHSTTSAPTTGATTT